MTEGVLRTDMRQALTLALIIAVTVTLRAPQISSAASGGLLRRQSSSAAGVVVSTTHPVCPDVYMIGARGSGEPEQSKPGELSYHGLGKEVYKIGVIIQTALRSRHMSFKTIADPYDAPSVDDLKPTKGEILTFNVKYYYDHNLLPFLEALDTGVNDAVYAARLLHKQCPHALLIMAGYSQGAMVMHQAELSLDAHGDTGVTSSIAGTILLADGDRIVATQTRSFGSSASTAEGVRTWFPTLLTGTRRRDVLTPATTASICNARDAVCDFSRSTIKSFRRAATVHTSYVTTYTNGSYKYVDKSIVDAANWIAALILARSRWAPITSPLPADTTVNPEAGLTNVACSTGGKCAAIGFYADSACLSTGLLLTGSGTSWTPVKAPVPADASVCPDPSIYSVSCPSASSCTAVGEYYPGGALVETMTGSSWAASKPPLPGNDRSDSGGLGYVACGSASSCTATGFYVDSSGHPQMMLETGWGTSWTATRIPAPAGAISGQSGLGPVACSSASSCTVLGSYEDSKFISHAMLITGSGTSWTITKVPLPANAAADSTVYLSSVACPSVSSCIAVGTYINSEGGGEGLLLTGSGTSWTATEAPLPAGAAGLHLETVACTSAAACAAGGTYVDSNGFGQGLLLTGSGTAWTATEAPVPAGARADSEAYVSSIACPHTSSCVATGGYESGPSGDQLSALWKESGASWIVTVPPVPVGAASIAEIGPIACLSVSLCTAVGEYADSARHSQGLLENGPA